MVSLLTLNIGAASEQRARRILEWLGSRTEEVFILSETSSGPGTRFLLDRFTEAGWGTTHHLDPNGDRGVAVISRIPKVSFTVGGAFEQISIPGRIGFTVLDTRPNIGVLGVYVPSRDRSTAKIEKKQVFISSLLDGLHNLSEKQRSTLVIGGDYNVVSRYHFPQYPGFFHFEYGMLEELDRLGFIDSHGHLHPGKQVYSWVGRTGDGYRYDYFHVGSQLKDNLEKSSYVDEPRGSTRLTDHSAVSLRLRVEIPELLDTRELDYVEEPTLF